MTDRKSSDSVSKLITRILGIRFSKTFSIIIIFIAASYLFFPNFLASVRVLDIQKNMDFQHKQIVDKMNARAEKFDQSVADLGIRDEGLLNCIKRAAEVLKTLQSHTPGYVESAFDIESLDCRRRGIVSLEGMQALHRLAFLNVEDNKITDITPLKNLKNLKVLNLHENTLDDNYILLEMSSLKTVTLPDLGRMFCSDVVKFTESAKFDIARRNHGKFNCLGGDNDISTLLAKKKSGEKLTHEQEMKIITYQLNQEKDKFRLNNPMNEN